MSSCFKNSNAENIRIGVFRNNVISSDNFQRIIPKKSSADPSVFDNQRPSSGRGNLNHEIRKRSFLHSGSEFEKDVDYRLTKSRSSLSRGSNLSKDRSNSGIRNKILPTGKSIITHEIPSSSFASFNINKQSSFKETYISTSNTNGNNIAYNNLNNLNYSSLTSSLTKRANNDSGPKDTLPHPLRIARKDIKAMGGKVNLSKSRSNRSSSMSNSKTVAHHKNKNLARNELLTFDENRETAISLMNRDDEKYDVDMEIEDDKLPCTAFQPTEKQFTSSKHDMDVDVEVCKLQTDQERLYHFHNVVMMKHKESLLLADCSGAEDPLEVCEYVSDICNHMKNTEFDFIAKPGYKLIKTLKINFQYDYN